MSQWIEKADADWSAALRLYDAEIPHLLGIVCFHAQQCAEKYLKAALVSSGVEPPRTHSIAVLYGLLAGSIDSKLTPAEQLVLDYYAVSTRYPGEVEPVTQADAEVALRLAGVVRDQSVTLMSVALAIE